MSRWKRVALGSMIFALAGLAGESSLRPRPATAAPTIKPADVRAAMLTRFKATKKKADPARVASIFLTAGGPRMKTKNGKTVVLEPVDAASPARTASVEPAELSKYKAYYDAPSAEPTAASAAPTVAMRDHTAQQTPVKDQRSRGTCMAFATVATMESNLKRQKNLTADISEEHLYKIVKDSVQKDRNSDGTTFRGLLDALSGKRVCSESQQPYEAPSRCQLAPACTSGAVYSIERSIFIPREPVLPFWAGNARVLEAFIDLGYDVAFSAYVAGTSWYDDAETGIIDVQLQSDGTPVDPRGSHGFALIGYNRPGGYFIMKNSWGTDWGRDGYARISYDYLQTYAKDAIVVLETGQSEPNRVVPKPVPKVRVMN